jgi:hypothetical protein
VGNAVEPLREQRIEARAVERIDGLDDDDLIRSRLKAQDRRPDST